MEDFDVHVLVHSTLFWNKSKANDILGLKEPGAQNITDIRIITITEMFLPPFRSLLSYTTLHTAFAMSVKEIRVAKPISYSLIIL
jgi:hypothetical protein